MIKTKEKEKETLSTQQIEEKKEIQIENGKKENETKEPTIKEIETIMVGNTPREHHSIQSNQSEIQEKKVEKEKKEIENEQNEVEDQFGKKRQ